jgi:hypothetical protein
MSVKRGNPLSREEVVSDFTNGETSSLRNLSDWDIQELTRRLNSLNGSLTPNPSPTGRGVNDPRVKMQRKIIAMAHEIGWNLHPASPQPSSNGEGATRLKIDMQKLNAWCEKHGYLHKKFNDYTYNELPRLIAQFEQAYKFYLEKLNSK